ncbi:MAG TPA: TraM recognition domain-containing protein [Candidatus Dormibacteraeota bacterium]|jgi:type IV secretory pathway TraG/TraD family ATPase VirD4
MVTTALRRSRSRLLALLRTAAAGVPPLCAAVVRLVVVAWRRLVDLVISLGRWRPHALWMGCVVAGVGVPPLVPGLAALSHASQAGRGMRRIATAAVPLLLAIPVIASIRYGLHLGRAGHPSAGWVVALSPGLAAGGGRLARAVDRRSGRRPRLRPVRATLAVEPYGLPPCEVVIGFSGRTWITAPWQHSAILLGGMGTGKTRRVIIPNVLAWTGCVLTTTTKRDVLDACAAVRSHRGTVWCFDPLGVLGGTPPAVRRLTWSPLRGCRDRDTARQRAFHLCQDAGKGSVDRTHWRTRGTQLLTELLHAAALEGLPMSTVVSWTSGFRIEPAMQILERHHDLFGLQVLKGIARTPDRERSSFWSAVAGILSAFDTEAVLRCADAADACGFEPYEFLTGANSIFVVAPSDAQVDLSPLVVGLVEEVRTAALRVSDRFGQLPVPLLLALDEVANICPLESLPSIVSEGRSRNIVVLAALQNMGQAVTRWGKDTAWGLVFGGGVATVLFPGCGDGEVLDRIEKLAGEHWVPQRTRSISRGAQGPFHAFHVFDVGHYESTQDGYVRVPRMPAAEIRQMAPGNAVVVMGHYPPGVIRVADHTELTPFRQWDRLTPVVDVVAGRARIVELHPDARRYGRPHGGPGGRTRHGSA